MVGSKQTIQIFPKSAFSFYAGILDLSSTPTNDFFLLLVYDKQSLSTFWAIGKVQKS